MRNWDFSDIPKAVSKAGYEKWRLQIRVCVEWMLSLVKVSEATATLPSQKKGEGFEVGIHFICSNQLMRKAPRAVQGCSFTWYLHRSPWGGEIIHYYEPSESPGASRGEGQHNKSYVCSRVGTEPLSVCRARVCTYHLLQPKHFTCALHLAILIS